MKFTLLIGLAAAVQLENAGVWDSISGAVDASAYTKETPKEYTEKEVKKIDYAAIERAKILAEQKEAKKAEKADAAKKDLEDMNIELFTFAKTLKPSNMRKALQIKEKLENDGFPPQHFRVSVVSLFQKGFKHEAVKNYKSVKESMEDLLVAEKNLNRNIDSSA